MTALTKNKARLGDLFVGNSVLILMSDSLVSDRRCWVIHGARLIEKWYEKCTRQVEVDTRFTTTIMPRNAELRYCNGQF